MLQSGITPASYAVRPSSEAARRCGTSSVRGASVLEPRKFLPMLDAVAGRSGQCRVCPNHVEATRTFKSNSGVWHGGIPCSHVVSPSGPAGQIHGMRAGMGRRCAQSWAWPISRAVPSNTWARSGQLPSMAACLEHSTLCSHASTSRPSLDASRAANLMTTTMLIFHLIPRHSGARSAPA